MFTGPYFEYLWAHFQYLLRHLLSACPALCLLFHPAIMNHSGARTNSLEDDCGAVCTVCVVSVRVCVCLPQASCDYFLYVKFILTVLWTSIAMWGFLKYLFWLPVYIYVRCVLVFLRNSMWDLFFFFKEVFRLFWLLTRLVCFRYC